MGNCLVTTLKSPVNNSELEKLGVLSFVHKYVADAITYDNNLFINSSSAFELSCDAPGYFYKASDPDVHLTYEALPLGATARKRIFYNSESDYEISVKTKYDITYLSAGSTFLVDVNDLASCKSLVTVLLENAVIPQRNISILGGIPVIESIDISSLPLDVDTFIQNAQAEGRNSGAVTISGSSMTFGVASRSNSFEGWVLNWVSDKIYIVGTNYVYEKNATAEEIAAWQASGQTVVDAVSGTVYPPSNA